MYLPTGEKCNPEKMYCKSYCVWQRVEAGCECQPRQYGNTIPMWPEARFYMHESVRKLAIYTESACKIASFLLILLLAVNTGGAYGGSSF